MSDGKPFVEYDSDWNVARIAGIAVAGCFGPGDIAVIKAAVAALVASAVGSERERCARIVESHANTEPDRAIAAAAAEIRGGK